MVAAGCEDVNELGATPLLSTAFRNYGDSLIEAGAPGAKREPDRAKHQLMVSSAETFRRSDHPVCAFASLSASTPPLRGGECVPSPLAPRGGRFPLRLPSVTHRGPVDFFPAQINLIDPAGILDVLERIRIEHDEIGASAGGDQACIETCDFRGI